MDYFEMRHPGSFYKKIGPNDAYWGTLQAPKIPSSPLKDKRLFFLGSSVTLGLRSVNESVADYLSAQDGAFIVKEAVSGTTLRQENPADLSYLSRLIRSEAYGGQDKFDAVIIQLSTNDAWEEKKLGSPLENENPATTYGAIEALITAIKKRFDCPLFFYSGAHYSEMNGKIYAELVKGMAKIAEKRQVGFINLFDDQVFNDLAVAHYSYWMSDGIHPYRSGYRAWWTPYFRTYLTQNLCKSSVFSL
ncbi:MAG: SGNH/GDSL hydrolase family protein [Bacilli bacterium]